MPGLGLSGILKAPTYDGLSRPVLSRTLSAHPGQDGLPDEDEETQPDDQMDSNRPPTPHEPLSISWPENFPFPETSEVADTADAPAPTRPSSPTREDSDQGPLPTLALPSLPPLESAPLGGPLTRSFSSFLNDDTKFFRPIRPAPANAGKPRRVAPTPLQPPASVRGLTPAVKRARAPESVATASAPAPPPASAAGPPAQPPRKKRRGMRPGTYMCLYKGELYECPHGCDIVEKGLLYDLLRR
jgi:hypothetical protein